MRIGSVLINGLEWRDFTLVKDCEIVDETGGNFGTARIKVLYDPTLGVPAEPGHALVIISEGGEAGEANQLFGQPLFGDPLFGEGASSQALFRGTITSCEPKKLVSGGIAVGGHTGGLFGEELFGEEEFGEEGVPLNASINVMTIEAVNRMNMLEGAKVEAGEYTADTDDVIIADVFGSELPTVDLTYVNNTTTLATFDRQVESVRAFMERLQERTGAVMWMGHEEQPDFHWMLPASNPAPWGFSDNPDFVTSFRVDREPFTPRYEWRTPANSVTVKGQVGNGGVRVEATKTNASSISAHGMKARYVIDPQITSVAEAELRAQIEVERDGAPQWNGTLMTRLEGIKVGMLLHLDFEETENFSGDFVVTRVTQRWVNKLITESTIEWGLYRPNEAALLRALAEASKHPGAVLPGQPAPGTVGGGEIQPGAVQTTHIADASITTAKIGLAQILTANIGLAQITNALINDLSATKINTGDLLVGGSGKVGQVTIHRADNSTFGWIGKNGSEYGAWFAQIRGAGTNWADARFRIDDNGAVLMNLVDGDGIELISFTNSLRSRLTNVGLAVLDAGAANGSSLTVADMLITNSSSSVALCEVFGSAAALRAIGGGSDEIAIASNGSSTGLYISAQRVVRSRRTGWTATSGPIQRGGFNSSGSLSVNNLAEHLAGLITDLIDHGLIGS
jgi:hypothetical protein